jgi:hypothetical protein
VYDCENLYRPEPPGSGFDPPGDEERYEYPARPESLSNADAVRSFVEAFERAYTLNDLFAEYATALDRASVVVEDRWLHEAPEGAAVGRIEYTYSYRIDRGDYYVDQDSPTYFASYYVDDAVVLRAVESCCPEDESKLRSDPLEEGRPVACS